MLWSIVKVSRWLIAECRPSCYWQRSTLRKGHKSDKKIIGKNDSTLLWFLFFPEAHASKKLRKRIRGKRSTDRRTEADLKRCPHCPKAFSNNRKLKRHMISHSDLRPYSCDICFKKFKRKYDITIHKRVHNGPLFFACDLCDMKLKSKGSLLTHRRRHLKDYVQMCKICDIGFVTNQEYNNHMGAKHGTSSHICDVCGRGCYDKASLQSHIAKHEKGYENNKFKCEFCDKTFLQEKYLKHHFRRIHKDGGQKFICDLCGKKVNSKTSLRDHLIMHSGSKPIECKECGKGFALKTTLKAHMRIHTGDRPYVCKECGKAFTQKTALTIHTRYHSGERPYVCDICLAGFGISLPKGIILKKVEHSRPTKNNVRVVLNPKNYVPEARIALKKPHSTTTKIKNKQYICTKCNNLFSTFLQLTLHDVTCVKEKYPHVCKYCDKVFTYWNSLKVHLARHENQEYCCEKCGRVFSNPETKEIHSSTAHTPYFDESSSGGFQCKSCDVKTQNKATMINHVNSTHQVITASLCDICGKCFSNHNKLLRHRKVHNDETPFGCRQCLKRFKNKSSLTTHVLSVHEKRIFICEQCGRSFKKKFSLESHHKEHAGDYAFQCHICDKKFGNIFVKETNLWPVYFHNSDWKPAQDQELIVEMVDSSADIKLEPQSPTSTKPPSTEAVHCDACDETYPNSVAFALHSIVHNSDNKYSCHFCNYRNASKYHIEMHIKAHEGTTKYKCEICQKAFTVSTHAIEHKYFHTGEKPFKCEICGKHFMFSWFLTSHRRTQHWEIMTGTPLVKYDCTICNKHYTSSTGLRRHNMSKHNDSGVDFSVLCDICGKCLSSKEKLKFHRRTHTGYKPFGCVICGKSFSRKEQLKEHERVHTGEKPFICKFCGKGFTQRSPLRIHERTHTGERPYICRICGKGIYKTEPYGCQEITVITIDGDNEVLVSIPTEDLTTVKPKPTKAKPKHTTKQTILEPVTTGTTEPSSSDKVPGIKKRDRVVCHECGILVTWDYLSTHMYEMHYYMSDLESPSVLCSECGTLCKNKRAHANHVRIHSFYCTQCPSVFKSENDLVKHSLVHTKKQYECNKCDLSFDDCYVFILHNESHDASGNFSCVKCNYVTGSCSSMKRHLQQHGGRTVHTCDICSRKFFGKTRFDAHMELHAGIPKYSCEYCPKKFSTKNYLKVHRELNHHKELYGYEMSYSCRECGRKFKFETSLKRHLSTIHKIGEDRTVTCKICYKKIANNYNLRVHMRLHTGEKTNMCESCGKAYSTYKSYKKHVLKHHPNVEPVPKTQPKSLQLGKGVTC
ncbi:zinc finger protein 62 homolog [Zophobas morio]|uniref:zinc finger protein 62 homolog n=1 Tax=Zophobas morio TaxID=2755281 RepID=UPI003082BBE6